MPRGKGGSKKSKRSSHSRAKKGKGRAKTSKGKRRKGGTTRRKKESELKQRITDETEKSKDIERRIAERDEELSDLEKRLNTLMLKYGQGHKPRQIGPPAAPRTRVATVEPINTRNDKNIGNGEVSDRELIQLLEEKLDRERAELALLLRLAELQERERALEERETSIREAEEEVERNLSSDDVEKVFDEMRKALTEKLTILEMRNRRLDQVEDELVRMEGFVRDQRDGLKKKATKGKPRAKGRGKKGRSKEK